jgi:hypothetical protein
MCTMETTSARERLFQAVRTRGMTSLGRPLTADQQAIWLSERVAPGRAGYHVTCAVRLSGKLDDAALAAAVADLHHRHQALRCRIVERYGEPSQHFDVAQAAWSRTNLDRGPVDARETALRRVIAADSAQPFDLPAGPLWRARLIRTAPDEHVLLLVLHHLVVDGWSLGLLLRDLLACYTSRTQGQPVPAPPAQRYAAWVTERARLEQTAATPERLRRIVRRLSAAPYRPELPGLGPPSADRRAEVVPVSCSDDVWPDFARACRRLGATEYMAMTGLFALVLARVTGDEDVVVAAPLALRSDPRTAYTVGCMISLVPIGMRVPPASAPAEAVATAQRAISATLSDGDVPYRAIAQAVGAANDIEDPLTSVSSEEFNVSLDPCEVAGLRVEPLPRAALGVRHALALSIPQGAGRAPDLLYPVQRWLPDAALTIANDLGGLIASVAGSSGSR